MHYALLIQSNLENNLIDSDFSGYSCLIKDLDEYFMKNHLELPTIQKPLEDIDFMKYLDSKDRVKPAKPFIFHRESGNGNNWVPEIISTFDKMLSYNQEINSLINSLTKLETEIVKITSDAVPSDEVPSDEVLINKESYLLKCDNLLEEFTVRHTELKNLNLKIKELRSTEG